MTTLADRTIAALRAEHESTSAIVSELSDDQLTGPSGAAEWTIADVLSHLGSGSIITLAGLRTALGAQEAPADGFNQSVWDQWNAMSPAEQRAGFLENDEALVATFEALDAPQRESLELHVGFLPFPLSVAAFGGMRLHETAQHAWDVRVARDPEAGLLPESASALAELFSDGLGFLLGFLGKADLINGPIRLAVAGTDYGITIGESIALVSPIDDPTATFDGPIEAVIRLIAGRLGPQYTSGAITVTGNTSLDDLRAAFPGF